MKKLRVQKALSALLVAMFVLLPAVMADEPIGAPSSNVSPGSAEWWFEKTGWLGVVVVFVWRITAWLAPRLDSLFAVHREHLRALDANMAAIARNDEKQTTLIAESTRMIEDIHYHTVPRLAEQMTKTKSDGK